MYGRNMAWLAINQLPARQYGEIVALSNDKILIVEDEQPIREMIAFHLARAGYDTT